YAEKVGAVTSKVQSLLSSGEITRKDVYVEPIQYGWSKNGTSRGNDTEQGKIVYLCGGNSISPNGNNTLDDITILASDPDAILFLGTKWASDADFLKLGFEGSESEAQRVIQSVFDNRKGYDQLTAYKSGEVYSVSFTLSRDVWDFAAFEYVSSSLFPDKMSFDYEGDLKTFFSKFMPVDYNGLWFYDYDDGSTEVTITDADGKTYTFDEPLDKVVLGYSGSGGPFTTLAALLGNDLPDYLVGIDNSLYKFRDDIYSAFCNEVPGFKDLPQVGGIGSDWDTKKIITLQPQAFITSIHHKSTVQANNVDADLAKVGIPTIYISYIDEDVDKARQSITNLGKLFGKEARAEEIADYYAEKVGAVTSKVQSLLSSGEITRKDVYIEPIQYGWSKNGTSRGNDTEQGKIVYLCGGNSISPNGNNTLDDITILASDPDAILFLGTKWASDADFLKLGFEGSESEAQRVIQSVFDNRKGYDQLGAYKSGEVYSVGFVLSRDVWDFAAFEYVSSSLFPDKMSFDYEGDLKTFYDKFMPVKYSGLWFYDYKS
ncbi:MAG: ABC transporter substrate-binding protein, partial [Candidatus Methanomethylophilaceae archaeon]|nr:ABC transporter substrate-binding protein [Candidatus Methanomethylophilaceae archaeon]